MSTLLRNAIILLIIVAVCIWAIYPPESKLRRGKDIAGGVSLIYGVDIKPGDPSDTLAKVASNVKERLDPKGVLEISVIPTGSDRLEITMPLPSAKVEGLKKDFEEKLKQVGTTSLTREELERVASMPEESRTGAAAQLAGKDADRLDKINRAILDFETKTKARAAYDPAEREVAFIREQIRTAGGESSQDPIVVALKEKLKTAEATRDSFRSAAAAAETAYDASSKAAVTSGLNSADLRRALLLSDKPFRLRDKDGKAATLESPRERAINEIKTQFPNQKQAVDEAIAKWNIFEANRRGLDDPQDVIRILKGAGVLNFRIAVSPGELANERELREQIKAGGPRNVKSDDARFYKVNKIEQWVDKVDELEALKKSASDYFLQRRLIAEEYKGAYYVLCWDKPGLRLTENDGQWMLDKAYPDQDELGRPAIAFKMDVLGADRLGKLTEPNKGRNMAVLLDDEVYTAPTLQSGISSSGRITGTFQQSEIDYVVRVLSAGSLKAKLSSEPISSSVLGPTLGQENLEKGLWAGVIAFVVVGGFMVLYYFSCGMISVVALALNALLIVAAMALNEAAFTLPGIAGIILTFGMAVDANVLIYERMREEMNLGHDLRTAIRLGYGRALSAIVDGHVTSLIAAVVLGFTGTQEIKGFALTLGIGIVTSLFSQLFATRFLFTFLVEKLHWRRITMLSIVMKWKLQPHIDWLGIRFFSYVVSFIIAGMGLFFLVKQGNNLLGTEFRGGTAVTLEFKSDGPGGKPVTMSRDDVKRRVIDIATKAPEGSSLKSFNEAEIIAVNPEPDGTSRKYTVKTLITDPKLVQEKLVASFTDNLDVRQGLTFEGSVVSADRAEVFPITSPDLGVVLSMPGRGGLVPDYDGGLAILLKNVQPPTSEAELKKRLESTREKSDFADILNRPHELRVLEGTSAAVKTTVVLVRDPEVSYQDRKRWESELRDREWNLVTTALTHTQTLAEVESFSPAVASSFRAQAITAVILSTLLIVIYVWVRFNSFRYSLAAIVCTLHDCLVAIGFVALATVFYEWNPSLAGKLGILPFKIDLNVVAAVLTILGYSLNDTIIIMDRVRENRGKVAYASRRVINDAINQTISRTIITAGTTFLATMVLYIVGGEGVRVFAYTMLIGILVGTYSSIAVAAPLLWVKAADPHGNNEPSAGLSHLDSGRAAA